MYPVDLTGDVNKLNMIEQLLSWVGLEPGIFLHGIVFQTVSNSLKLSLNLGGSLKLFSLKNLLVRTNHVTLFRACDSRSRDLTFGA